MLEFRPLPIDHPDALVLIEELQAFYVERYGDGDLTPMTAAEFAPPAGYFVVGHVDGAVAACGGWRLHADGPGATDLAEAGLRPGDAELKRMYVRPGHRGRGYARALLAHLEDAARSAGARRVVLETGLRQPEAIALYRSAGYVPTTKFGVYRHEPGSRCFAKDLLAGDGGPAVGELGAQGGQVDLVR